MNTNNNFLNQKHTLTEEEFEALDSLHEALCWESTNYRNPILSMEHLRDSFMDELDDDLPEEEAYQKQWEEFCKECCQEELSSLSFKEVLKSDAVAICEDMGQGLASSYGYYLEEFVKFIFEKVEYLLDKDCHYINKFYDKEALEEAKEICKRLLK